MNWTPQNKGNTYIVNSTHYVKPLFPTVDEFGVKYWDPFDFMALQTEWNINPIYSPLLAEFIGYGPSVEVDASPLYRNTYIQAGGTSATLDTSAPVITNISPWGAALGSSGTLTVSGTNLLDPITHDFTAAITTGTGVTVTPPTLLPGQQQSPTQLFLHYQVASGASAGTTRGKHNLAITTGFGTSAGTTASAFTAGDPTPVIHTVSPSVWTPGGATINFTINGAGFGSTPIINLNAADLLAPVTQYSSASDNGTVASINGQATVVVCPIGGLVPVRVTSKGYDGNGFIATPGNSDTVTLVNAASTVGIGTVAPQIMFQGTNIAGNDQNPQAVVVGQQVTLRPSLGGIPMACVTNQTWALSGTSAGLAVGGYVASNQLGCVDPFPIPAPHDQCGTEPPQLENGLQPATLYWIPNGTQTAYVGKVTYSYIPLNQTQPVATAVAFSVGGPTNVQVHTNVAAIQVVPPNESFGADGLPMLAPWNIPSLFDNTTNGMQFDANSVAPPNTPGEYAWVQLVPNNNIKRLLNNGAQVGTLFASPCDPSAPTPNCGTPELDSDYPYPNVGTVLGAATPHEVVVDTPWWELGANGEGEQARSFFATTYLLWNPNLPNSIPVPLGSIQWSACGDAVNTLSGQPNGAAWSLQNLAGCSSAMAHPAFAPGASYPQWTSRLLTAPAWKPAN
jgi:hypothetical protein